MLVLALALGLGLGLELELARWRWVLVPVLLAMLVGRAPHRKAANGQWSAVSCQRPAISSQRSEVGDQCSAGMGMLAASHSSGVCGSVLSEWTHGPQLICFANRPCCSAADAGTAVAVAVPLPSPPWSCCATVAVLRRRR